MAEMRRVVGLTCKGPVRDQLEPYVGQAGEVVARYRAVPPYPSVAKLRMEDGWSFLEDAETEAIADA
jgi:hypothetical protein